MNLKYQVLVNGIDVCHHFLNYRDALQLMEGYANCGFSDIRLEAL